MGMKVAVRRAALAAVVLITLVAPGAATAAPGVSGIKLDGRKAAVLDYWTAARMQAAEPLPVAEPPQPLHDAEPGDVGDKPEGPSVSIPPTPPTAGPAARAPEPRSHVGFGLYAIANPAAYPYTTQGKVFFQAQAKKKKRRGWSRWKWFDFVCSATTVSAQNRSLVMTAGHCVNETRGRNGRLWFRGNWNRRWTFVPGYLNGNRPYGQFVARSLTSINGWINDSNFNYDVGAAVLGTNRSGQTVADVAGTRGIIWNFDPRQYISAYGYPAARPFDGERLFLCQTYYGGDDPQSFNEPGPATSVIGCNMTPGSSGGGWIIGGGRLSGVNSYGYGSEPNHMYGPYFGDSVAALYACSSTAPPTC